MSTAHINVFLWKKDSTNMQSSVENQSIDYFYLPLTLRKALLADFSFWKQPGEFLLTDIQVNFANHLYTLNSIRMSTTHTITQSSESQPLCIMSAARASKAFTQSKWRVFLLILWSSWSLNYQNQFCQRTIRFQLYSHVSNKYHYPVKWESTTVHSGGKSK